MMTLEKIHQSLQDRRLSVVAKETGLHYNTVRKVANDPKQSVSYQVLKKLSDYLSK